MRSIGYEIFGCVKNGIRKIKMFFDVGIDVCFLECFVYLFCNGYKLVFKNVEYDGVNFMFFYIFRGFVFCSFGKVDYNVCFEN